MTKFDHGWPEFWDLWATDRWEVATHNVLREVLTPGDIFLDIGAWIGPVTIWAHQLGARVIAVEPDPVAYEELRTVVPRKPPFVEAWPGALTIDGGTVRLAPNPKPEGAFGDSMSRIADEGIKVVSWTLEQILNGRVPKLMKMDVEGYEVTLMPAIIDWLTEHNVALHISCHGEVLDRQLFAGYREVRMPEHTWGDIVALP
jgi:FkbM family methyltransferase